MTPFATRWDTNILETPYAQNSDSVYDFNYT